MLSVSSERSSDWIGFDTIPSAEPDKVSAAYSLAEPLPHLVIGDYPLRRVCCPSLP